MHTRLLTSTIGIHTINYIMCNAYWSEPEQASLSICTVHVSSVRKSEGNEMLEFTHKVHELHKQQLAVKKE